MEKTTTSPLVIYLVCAIAALTGMLFGFDTGIISGALLFIQDQFPLTTQLKEWIVSSVLIGAMAGALGSGSLTDHYGRRRVILLISALFIIGTLIASCAMNVTMIITGRLILGFAIGMGSYTAPLYIAEAAPFKLRGGLVSLNQLAITIGIFSSYCINYSFSNMHDAWRWMFAIGVIPAVLLGLGMLVLPESPRWLVKKGQLQKARSILLSLRGGVSVEEELQDIQKSLTLKQAKFTDVFASWIRPVLFLGIMLGLIQQISGINTIIYYAPTVFQMAGFHDASSSIFATIGIGTVNVLATIFSIYYLDKMGRRPLLLAGLIGMGLSLLCLSFAFHQGANTDLLRYTAVTSIFVYIICFAFSLGTMLWLMVSEIFPLEVRGVAMGIAVFSCWFWNFLVSSTFLTLVEKIGASNAFLFYGCMCGLGWIFSYYKIPETKGVSLEQIENNIRNGLPLREIGQPVTDGLASETI